MSADENLGFWLYNNTNGLRGAESTLVELPDGRVVLQKDPDNPAVLEDEYIIYCLQTARQARSDFCRLFPDLDTDSQERLTNMLAQNPAATKLLRDSQEFFDMVQQLEVTSGVRTRLSTRPRNQGVEDRLKV